MTFSITIQGSASGVDAAKAKAAFDAAKAKVKEPLQILREASITAIGHAYTPNGNTYDNDTF